MIKSYEFDLRTLFKKFYCPICGQRLEKAKEVSKLSEQQKKLYYKKLYPYGVPIELEVGKVKQLFKCHKCNYYNTTDNQLIIHKKQKQLKKKILSENE